MFKKVEKIESISDAAKSPKSKIQKKGGLKKKASPGAKTTHHTRLNLHLGNINKFLL